MEPISLLELNQVIKETLSRALAPSYWVVAEISEIRVTQKGHCYLELVQKEDNSLLSKSRATIWSYTYRNLNGWFEAITGSPLSQGMSILANIQVGYHELYGLNLNIKDIDPKYTLGERERKKQETIQQLQKDGVFDLNQSLDLPLVPQRIGVISSPTAAGLGDFMDQLEQSPYRFETTLYKVTLQGTQAAESVTEALLEAHGNDFDLVVIIRGGGAQIDLDTFDDYELCSHIAQYPIPVITGIGHERDHTIADMVAHTSLKTPTAVAEFLTTAMRSYDEQIQALGYHIGQVTKQIIRNNETQLQSLKQAISFAGRRKILEHQAGIAQKSQHLKSATLSAIQGMRYGLSSKTEKLPAKLVALIDRNRSQLALINKSIQLSDPLHVLKRGYTITLVDDKPLHKAGKLTKGQQMTTITDKSRIVSSFAKEIKDHG
ncbi:MAG: exodeoxyribonuclease VII large subunit [Cyclobacteriaceae bacterium]